MIKINNSYLFGFSIWLLLSINVFGQNDQEVIKILDKFAATASGAPSVSMKFRLITTDQLEKTSDTLAGSLILSKDRYKLDLPDNITWFNGETSWSYLPAEKEVTITKADKKDNSFQNRPSAIFSVYKNGYKSRLIEEKEDVYTIDLYPDDIKSELVRIRLHIDKFSMALKSLEYKNKDGRVITVNVQDYNLKFKPQPDTFTFRKENFKGVDIIDMR